MTRGGAQRRVWWQADGWALLATVLWAGSFVFARGLADVASPWALNFWRWSVATLVIVPFGTRRVREEWSQVRSHVGYLLLVAATGIALYNLLVYVAAAATPAVNLALIAVGSPIFIVVFARFLLGEVVRWRQVLGIVVAVIGVASLVTGGRLGAALSAVGTGDAWMLAATVVFATYSVLLRRRPSELSVSTVLVCSIAAGAALTGVGHGVELVLRGADAAMPWSTSTVAGVLYLGVGASAIAFAAWNRAIGLVGPTRPAAIYYLVPVFTGALAAVFLDEPLTMIAVASGAVIIVGVALAAHRPRESTTE